MKGVPQGRYTREFCQEAVKLVTEERLSLPEAAPPVVPGAIDVRVLGEGTKGRQTGRCRQDVQALD